MIPSVVVWYKINCCPKETILSTQKKVGGKVIEKIIEGKTNVIHEKEKYLRRFPLHRGVYGIRFTNVSK